MEDRPTPSNEVVQEGIRNASETPQHDVSLTRKRSGSVSEHSNKRKTSTPRKKNWKRYNFSPATDVSRYIKIDETFMKEFVEYFYRMRVGCHYTQKEMAKELGGAIGYYVHDLDVGAFERQTLSSELWLKFREMVVNWILSKDKVFTQTSLPVKDDKLNPTWVNSLEHAYYSIRDPGIKQFEAWSDFMNVDEKPILNWYISRRFGWGGGQNVTKPHLQFRIIDLPVLNCVHTSESEDKSSHSSDTKSQNMIPASSQRTKLRPIFRLKKATEISTSAPRQMPSVLSKVVFGTKSVELELAGFKKNDGSPRKVGSMTPISISTSNISSTPPVINVLPNESSSSSFLNEAANTAASLNPLPPSTSKNDKNCNTTSVSDNEKFSSVTGSELPCTSNYVPTEVNKGESPSIIISTKSSSTSSMHPDKHNQTGLDDGKNSTSSTKSSDIATTRVNKLSSNNNPVLINVKHRAPNFIQKTERIVLSSNPMLSSVSLNLPETFRNPNRSFEEDSSTVADVLEKTAELL